MTINETYQEISSITQELIGSGLSIKEVWPNRSGLNITWKGNNDVSIALKNLPYEQKYNQLKLANCYNFLMVDGAMVQMMYTFENNNSLLSHRLAYFPCPSLERYDEAPEAYDEIYYSSSEFHDMKGKNSLVFPIRFDYLNDQKIFKDVDHPYSHATFGEFKYCRIPVSSPLTPSTFVHFLLRNFYNYHFRERGAICKVTGHRFPATITFNEKSILHLAIN